MRLVGTGVICVVVAFGAAFLVARAFNGQSPAKAATTVSHTTVATVPTQTDPELGSQFAPMSSSLKHRPRPHRRKVHHKRAAPPAAPSQSSSPSPAPTPTYSTPAPTYTAPAPVYHPAPAAPVHHSSGSTHHHSSSGSGTTTIG